MSSPPNAPLQRQAQPDPNRIDTLEFAFDIAVTPGDRASTLQSPDRLLLAIRQELLATIDAVVADAADHSADITVTELDIDLGTFDDPPDWPRVRDRLRQTLQSALSPHLRRGAHIAGPQPAMSQVPPTALAITAASDRAALLRVLTGASEPKVEDLTSRIDLLGGDALSALLTKLDAWQVHDRQTGNAAAALVTVRQAEHSLSAPSPFLRDCIVDALFQDIRPSAITTPQQSHRQAAAMPNQQSAIAMLGLDTGLNPAEDAATRLFADLTPNDAAGDDIALDPAALRLWVDGVPRRAETIVATLRDADVSQLVNSLIPDRATALRAALANLAQYPDPALATRLAAIALLSRTPVDLAKLRTTQTAKSTPPEAALAALLAATGENPLQAAALAVSLGQSEAATGRPEFRADETAASQSVPANGPASAQDHVARTRARLNASPEAPPTRPATHATAAPADADGQKPSSTLSNKARNQALHAPDDPQRQSGSSGSVRDDISVSTGVTGKIDPADDTARFATRRAAKGDAGASAVDRHPVAEGANPSQESDNTGVAAEGAGNPPQQPSGTGNRSNVPDSAPAFSSRRDPVRDSPVGDDNDKRGAAMSGSPTATSGTAEAPAADHPSMGAPDADQITEGQNATHSTNHRVGGTADPIQVPPDMQSATTGDAGDDIHAIDDARPSGREDAGKPVIKDSQRRTPDQGDTPAPVPLPAVSDILGNSTVAADQDTPPVASDHAKDGPERSNHDPAVAGIPSHDRKPPDEKPEAVLPDVPPGPRSAHKSDVTDAVQDKANAALNHAKDGPKGSDHDTVSASMAADDAEPSAEISATDLAGASPEPGLPPQRELIAADRNTANPAMGSGARDTSKSDQPTQDDAQTIPPESGQATDPREKSATAAQAAQQDAPTSRSASRPPQTAEAATDDTSMVPAMRTADGANASADPAAETDQSLVDQSRQTPPAPRQDRFAAEQRMRDLFEKLTGAQSSSQLAQLELVHSVLGSDRAGHSPSRAGFWVAALAAAAHADQKQPSLVAAFVQAIATKPEERTTRLRGAIARLGYAAAGVDATLRRNVRTELQRMLAPEQPPARHIPMSRPTPTETAAKGNRLITRQSGLVLFHPYLAMLFARLDVGHDKKGIARDHLDRAAAALWWLAMGAQEQVPVADPLVLCLLGLPPDFPAPTPVRLTKDDTALIDGLIAAVIAQWGRLGKTSPEGLRAAFVQREGVFQPDATTPQLTVNAGPYDMLLDGLPWAINLIALPWMSAPLSVKWRPGND